MTQIVAIIIIGCILMGMLLVRRAGDRASRADFHAASGSQRRCPHCGLASPDFAVFCGHCGKHF